MVITGSEEKSCSCCCSKPEQGSEVVQTSAKLGFIDHLGSVKARWAIGRMEYTVKPGLYSLGSPDSKSEVFVSANYKLSFDKLRSQLGGVDCWILVIDTKGINVWCAAGKGTFGTDELVSRIESVGLKDVVEHRRIIVPQLGAPGVAGFEVKKQTGFGVRFGPVKAEDIKPFLANRLKATEEMRRVQFGFWDRTVLVPVELVGALKIIFYISLALFLLSGLSLDGYSADRLIDSGLKQALMAVVACVLPLFLFPPLLPVLPGKAFAFKGAVLGAAIVFLMTLFQVEVVVQNWATTTAWALFLPAVASFVGMNFTGSSTYTSFSGVKLEMKVAVPIQLVLAVFSAGFWVAGRLI